MPTPEKTTATGPHPTLVAGDAAPNPDTGIDNVKADVDRIVDAAEKKAQQFSEQARIHGSAFAERRKDGVADAIAEAARALREAGGSLNERSDVESILERAAATLDDVSAHVRSASFINLYGKAEDFARTRPLMVAGCAALAGFALARIIPSGRTADHGRRERSTS